MNTHNQKIFYVYKHTFLNNAIYIGKGKNKRAFSITHRNKKYKNIVNKYGNPKIEIIKDNLFENEAFDLEIETIKYYKDNRYVLLNLTNGGEGVSGWTATQETKQRMSEAKRNMTQVTKQKMSESRKGIKNHNFNKVFDFNYRQKLSDAKIGKTLGSETKQKMSLAKLREKSINFDNTLYLFINKDGTHRIDTQYDMRKEFGSGISNMLCGLSKSCKGWKYCPIIM